MYTLEEAKLALNKTNGSATTITVGLSDFILHAAEAEAINLLLTIGGDHLSNYELLNTIAASKAPFLYIVRILNRCFNAGCLTKKQIAGIMFKAIVLSHGNTEFNYSDLTIENLCAYINKFCDASNAADFEVHFSKCYEFRNLQEKILYLEATFNHAHRYYISDISLNYREAIYLTEHLKSGSVAVGFIKNNQKSITKEQKFELLLKAVKFDPFFCISDVELDLEQTITLCKLKKSMGGLIVALQRSGQDKNTILRFIESFIQDVDLEYFQFDIADLKLSKEEIVTFVQRNPGSGHIIDNWVTNQVSIIVEQSGNRRHNSKLSAEVLRELLELRLKNSENYFSFHLFETYNIQDADLPVLIATNSEYIKITPEMEKYLDWKTIYKSYRESIRNHSAAVIALRECMHLSQQLQDYFLGFPEDIEKIQEEYTTSTEIVEHLSEVCERINQNFGNIIDFAPAAVVLNNVSKKLAIKEITYDNVESYLMNVVWLVALSVRLLEEVEHEKLRAAFNNEAFATTLEEIANLAAPHLRNKFIDNILSIVNDENKFHGFSTLLVKANKRSHIPALIISSAVSRPLEFAKIISMIGSEYSDNRNLMVLLNGLNSLFDALEISDENKFKIISKVLSYKLVIDNVDSLIELQSLHAQRIAEDVIDYNTIYITEVKLKAVTKFALQALDINGKLVDLLDISLDHRLVSLDTLLGALIKNKKKLARNIEEILARVENTQMFPCGFASEQQALLLLQGLAAINKLKVLVEDKQFYKNSWQDSYAASLQSCFNISTTALPTTLDQINACREPYSLVSYYAQLKSLKHGSDKYLAMLKQYVNLISSPWAREFYKYRYDLQQQPQLRAALNSDPHLQMLWRQGYALSYDTFADKITTNFSKKPELKISAAEFLIRQIKHFEHLPPHKFQFIHRYLNAVTLEHKAVALEDCMAQLAIIKVGNNYYDKELRANLNLQLGLINFFNSHHRLDDKQKLKLLIKIKNMVGRFPSQSQFAMDLNNLTDLLTVELENLNIKLNVAVKKISTKEWQIADTDHFWHMFRIGTDVIGSCQNVNGSPNLNRCLIGGYVLSGHVRQIAIINQNHEIVARAVLRMMRDAKTHVPVLFLEEIYPHSCNVKYKEAIQKFAIVRAWQLGCPLVCNGSSSRDTIYPNPIEVVEVNFSEYVDALGTEQNEGYAIEGASLLFRPSVSRQQLPKMLCAYGMAMGRPAYGPRPMTKPQDLCIMYQNMRAITGVSIPEFYKRINLPKSILS